MTVEAFKYAFKSFMVGHHRQGWKPASFVEKRNAVSKKVYRFNFTITDEDFGAPAPTSDPYGMQPAALASIYGGNEVSSVFNDAAEAMSNNEQLDAQMARQGLFDIESNRFLLPDITDVQLDSQMVEPEDDADMFGGANSDYEEADESEPLDIIQTRSYTNNGVQTPIRQPQLRHTSRQAVR